MPFPPKQLREKSAAVSALRIAASFPRKRWRPDAVVKVAGGIRVGADLSTPHGLHLYRYGFRHAPAQVSNSLLEPGDIFVDGGANAGLFTLTAAARVGRSGRVIACEPAHETMLLLRANAAANGFDWVDLHEVALGDENRQATLHCFGAGAGMTSLAPAYLEGSTPETVTMTTLDNLAEGLPVRVVKLDIEGAEILALRGATELLENTRPAFVLEVEAEHLERQRGSVGELQSIFQEAGYEAFEIEPGPSLMPISDLAAPRSGQDVLFRPLN